MWRKSRFLFGPVSKWFVSLKLMFNPNGLIRIFLDSGRISKWRNEDVSNSFRSFQILIRLNIRDQGNRNKTQKLSKLCNFQFLTFLRNIRIFDEQNVGDSLTVMNYI